MSANLTPQQYKHIIKIMEELQSTDGWKFLIEQARDEQDVFIRATCAPSFPFDPLVHHYNRGILQATYSWLDMPNKVIETAKAKLPLESLVIPTTPIDPAKAGESKLS